MTSSSTTVPGVPALDVDAFALLEASPTPVVLVGWDAVVSYVNAAAECLLHRPRAELLGRPGGQAFPGNGGSELGTALGAALQARRGVSLEAYVPPAGRWIEVDARPTTPGLAIFLRDLTGTRAALAALRESEQWGALVYDAANDGMVLSEVAADGTQRVRSVNASFLRASGRPRAETEGRSIDEVFPRPRFDIAHAKFAEALRLRAPVSYEHDISGAPARRVVEVTITPLIDEASGAVTHTLAVTRDASARVVAEEAQRRLEAQLQHAQKMDAIGRLAGSVAHDFNNLLTAIRCHCDILLDDASLGSESAEDVGEIARTADRGAALTRQLLAFSRKQRLQPRVFDLNGVLAGVERLLRRLLVEDVVLVARPSSEPCPVLADAAQLEQVLVNLAVNARDAMPAGGALTIETRRATVDAPLTHAHGVVPAGRYVVLAVTDSGTGMSPDTLGHLFEPFFTTKPPGQGTGLGLATVYGIVSQCAGHVVVRSGLEQGSTFSVYLPAAGPPD